jgi:toxin ParE1/3/4
MPRVTLMIFGHFTRIEANANTILSSIKEQFKLLEQFPYAGRARDELATGLRSLSADNHLIFYRLLPTSVAIIRVLNAKQNIEAIFKEES